MKRFAVILCLVLFVVAASFPIRRIRRNVRDENCRNQLRLVALLLKEHVSEHGRLPEATTYDRNGIALQSWRLSVVQTREYFDFARHMDVSEPWTTTKNRHFLQRFDDSIFGCPSLRDRPGVTQYVAITGPGTAWGLNTKTEDIRDETLLIIEWPNSDIYWAEPRDIALDALSSLLAVDEFHTEHSARLRYVDWSATVHEMPLDSSTYDRIRQLALVPASGSVDTPNN